MGSLYLVSLLIFRFKLSELMILMDLPEPIMRRLSTLNLVQIHKRYEILMLM